MGLVPLIWAGEVVALDATCATIQMQTDSQLTYLRRPRPGAVPVWTLVQPDSATGKPPRADMGFAGDSAQRHGSGMPTPALKDPSGRCASCVCASCACA